MTNIQTTEPRTADEQTAHLTAVRDDLAAKLERNTVKGNPDKIADAQSRLEAAQAELDTHKGA